MRKEPTWEVARETYAELSIILSRQWEKLNVMK